MSHAQNGSSQVDIERPCRQRSHEIDFRTIRLADQVCRTHGMRNVLDNVARRCVSPAGVDIHRSGAYAALCELRWQSERATGVLRFFVPTQHQSMVGRGPAHPASKRTWRSDISVVTTKECSGAFPLFAKTTQTRVTLSSSFALVDMIRDMVYWGSCACQTRRSIGPWARSFRTCLCISV